MRTLRATMTPLGFALVFCVGTSCTSNQAIPNEAPSPPMEVESCVESLSGLASHFEDERTSSNRLLVVFKRFYKIGLYHSGKLLKEGGVTGCFDISMGENPYSAKYEWDNASTPEGWYFVAAKRTSNPDDSYPETAFYKSLSVSYPNLDDVSRAFEHQVIDEATANNMRRQIALGEVPRQDSPMGGGILIHAWYTSDRSNTLGCVGVADDDIDWLFDRIEVRDPILIVPWRTKIQTDGSVAHDDSVQAPLEHRISSEEYEQLVDRKETERRQGVVFKPILITP
jgi:hypothetical protein